jgi:hypothetical protein
MASKLSATNGVKQVSKQVESKLVMQLLHVLRDLPTSSEPEDVPLRLISEPSVSVNSIPTFDSAVSYPVSPMLAARFSFGSTCHFGCDTWLSREDMVSYTELKVVKEYHLSLREHWVDSAPMLFSDAKLSLFGVTEDVPDSLIYLVWANSSEPEVWTYLGMEQNRFSNLADYLKWCAD